MTVMLGSTCDIDVARGLEAYAAQMSGVEGERRAVVGADVDHDILRFEVEPAADVLDHAAQVGAHGPRSCRAVEIAPIEQVGLDLLAQLQEPQPAGFLERSHSVMVIGTRIVASSLPRRCSS